MEKIIIDYGEWSSFKGAKILYPYLEEGLKCVKEQHIKDVCIWQDEDEEGYCEESIVDFNFLKGYDFIETFHWLALISEKSCIDGLYYLTNLKDFRWVVDVDIKIDFSKLTTIETINTEFHDGLLHLEKLKNLKKFFTCDIESENLQCLSGLTNLEYLRIIGGDFSSLEGLENCKHLKTLDIARCFKLIHAMDTLQKMPSLKSVIIESCGKKHDIDVEVLRQKIKHVWVG